MHFFGLQYPNPFDFNAQPTCHALVAIPRTQNLPSFILVNFWYCTEEDKGYISIEKLRHLNSFSYVELLSIS